MGEVIDLDSMTVKQLCDRIAELGAKLEQGPGQISSSEAVLLGFCLATLKERIIVLSFRER